MNKIFEFWKNYRLRRGVKKRISALKTFRHSDEDILSDSALEEIDALIADGEALVKTPDNEPCKEYGDSCSAVLAKYNQYGFMREILDVLAVALMVAFGIRALFFQPFKIPTSSMQPTLYGIHYIDIEKARAVNGVSPLLGKAGTIGDYLLFSARRAELNVAPKAKIGDNFFYQKKYLFFDNTIIPAADGRQFVLPGTPDKVEEYSQIVPAQRVSGKIVDGFLSDGDHLFVNRLSLHITGPRRGDVMVFETAGLCGPRGEKPSDSGAYYIKRIAGMPGDTLKIQNDVLLVKEKGSDVFVPVYELAPNMKKLYSGKGGYQGHCNELPGGGSNFLRRENDEFKVPEDHYFMLGDNTRFSADSRVWGAVPRRNLIGRPAIVFWPFSRRWGTVDRLDPIDAPTGEAGRRTFKSMYLQ